MRFVLNVEQPHQLWCVFAIVLHVLVRRPRQLARKHRLEGVRPRRERRMEIDTTDQAWRERLRCARLDCCEPRDVEDHRAAVDVRHIRTIGMIRPDLDLVRSISIVERLVPRWETAGQTGIALASAGQPPTPDLSRLPWIPQIDGDPDLIVLRVRRMKVRHAGREMRELAVNEPQVVYAARFGAGRIEEREAEIVESLRACDFLGIGDVEYPHAGPLAAG